MSKEIESVATALFDKVRSRFENVTLGDEKAKATTDPEKARFFNFTYSDPTGAQFGTVTISLIDEVSLKVYYGQNISNEMDRDQRKDWYMFLRNLREFARRNLLTFDTRDITKSGLELQDIKQQAKVDDVAGANDVAVTESRLYGTSRNSYADIGECRLLIKHDGLVNDDVRGDRARKIKEIFVETPRGERFLMPFKNLHGARAMCNHITHGGDMRDEIGECITNMVSEMSSMAHFVRATKRRQFEDNETASMAQAATRHYLQLKNTLRHLANKKHYADFVEQFVPENTQEEDVDVDALRERFVKKVYDDRFTEALPTVYKAYKKYQSEAAAQLGNELDEWAKGVTESVWDDAESTANFNLSALQDKMAQPWTIGMQGIDATTDLKDLLPGEDLTDLNNAIYHYAKDQGPDQDARPLVKTWLRDHKPEVLSKLEIGQRNADDANTNHINPVSPQDAHPNDQFGASSMDDPVTDPNVKLREADDLDFIRSLAGIKR